MPETKKEKSSVLFISTFPPRECGIATFTQDLATAFDALYSPREESSIAAINIDEYTRLTYSKKVWAQFPQTNRESYRRLAKEINDNHDIKLVNIQHEFGIFGGEYGSYILDFLAHIIKPVCTTFHTVLPEPDEKMLTTVRSISEKISFIVVMTKTSEEILTGKYGIDSRKIRIIPHGIHQRPYRESKIAKTELGLPTDRPILSSFGLLGPGKGIEYAIDALAEVTKTYPNVLYLIIGATHPVVLRKDGEK